jgi:type III restriction enzyme
MKIELKPFQEIAAREVLGELLEARASAGKGKAQAVVLSAPTGSGKTITLAAVIDQTFGGTDGIEARPNTVFLWLSDSPELNVQSKNKLLAACDNIPFRRMVTVESDSFDQEQLLGGHVYFINTQLLGKDKRLTAGGDKRKFTFWQTVANTVAKVPEDFVLVIDEAHRGAGANDKTRTPIMQKFIKGSPEDGLPAVPLVLGMSATPQRFTELLGNTTRTQRPIVITAEDVRSSGLLKDILIVHNPKTAATGDLTLLESAASRSLQFSQLWAEYCKNACEIDVVHPILVVQVEDGTTSVTTRTNLSEVIRVIERQLGSLANNEIVHCFQDQSVIEVGGHRINKLEASRVQDTPEVKVVLFKTALTTGWDCPRAEVMMSFRRAQDPTSIAQLVGRMIRTPLARRIGSNEVLDTVELFLPHFDADALQGVLKKLESPEGDDGIPTRVETRVAEYGRNPAFASAFSFMSTLHTYSIDRAPRMSEAKRALRLAGLLVNLGIDVRADEQVRSRLVEHLKGFRDHLADTDPQWEASVREGGELEVDVTSLVVGEMAISSKTRQRLHLSEENIDQLFDAAGRKLATGEGLHRTYWKRYHDILNPSTAKLELFLVGRHPDALEVLEKVGRTEFDRLWSKHFNSIQVLPVADKERMRRLMQASGHPVEHAWELPEKIVERVSGSRWDKHLFIDSQGGFHAQLNGWEKSILETEMNRKSFIGWLRNSPQREWAFCIPYELGGTRAFYPDFVIVRKSGPNFQVDLIEPHDDSRSDTWAKAKGLAVFADAHGISFGRLIVARKKNGQFQVADLNVKATRDRARKMQSQSDLESLFA